MFGKSVQEACLNCILARFRCFERKYQKPKVRQVNGSVPAKKIQNFPDAEKPLSSGASKSKRFIPRNAWTRDC